jgi:HNH endonuclease
VSQTAKRRHISYALRFRILERDRFRCQYCGSKAGDVEIEVDHLWPVSKGGTSADWNLITACRQCNQGKTARGSVRFAARFAMFQGFYQSTAKEIDADREIEVACERLFWNFFGNINDWLDDVRLRQMLGDDHFELIVDLEQRQLLATSKVRDAIQ